MGKYLDTIKTIFFCILCIAGTVFFIKATISIPDLKPAVASLNTALTTVNRPETGTLAEVNKSVLAFKSVLVHTDLVIDHENKQLSTLDNQERTLFSDAHQLFSNVSTTLHQGQETMISAQETLQGAASLFATTETTVLGVRPVLSHLDATVVDVDTSVTRFNALFASPRVAAITKNVETITYHGANIMDTADQVSAKATHSYLHPSTNPWVKGWDATSPYILTTLKVAGTLLP